MAVCNRRKPLKRGIADFLKALSLPVGFVMWMYAPVWVAIANGGTLSKAGVVLSWLIPVFILLAVLEMKFIASLD